MSADRKPVSLILLTIATLAVLACLIALGTWQVVRLEWKQNLIAETNARVAAEPQPLAQIMERFEETRDVDYFPVRLEGRFLDGEAHYLNTLDGISGWNIYAPFELTDGQIVIVNRGFVPDQLKAPEARGGLPEGVIELTGLSRNAPSEKPSSILPDNDQTKNQFFWRSINNMASIMGLKQKERPYLPFFVDAGADATPESGWPRAGTTRISFSNNHLQYVITWYGLALALVGVYIAFVRKRMRERNNG
ncbi:MAG: SURF1 family protein [Pseudomonadota bacterium]